MSSPRTDAQEVLGGPDDLVCAKQIDSICDSFEKSWKSGHRPDLTEYLLQTEVPQSTLFVELVLIDIAYRRRQGENPSVAEYAERFPQFRETLNDLSLPSATGRMQTVVLTSLFEKLGRFELVDRLGEGAFGIVWKAWDTKMERWVAVKQFRSIANHQQQVFNREARAVAQLDHRNVVRVFEVSQDEEAGFIVFELINGPTLAKWIRQHWTGIEGTGVPPQEAARIAAELACGLQIVHEKGVIHRDFKPGNILLNEQEVPKIADFGLARHVDALTTISDEKAILGTVPYMSPEQCQGRPIDARTDIYSLGVVLYEMLTGRRPFEGTRAELLESIPRVRPVPPSELADGIPPSLENICLKALSKEPADRYHTAALMQADLDRFLKGDDIPQFVPPLGVRLGRWTRRHMLVTASSVAVLAAASLAAGSFALMYNSLPADERRSVSLTTKPEGAKVAFIPLHRITGEPLPEQIIHARGVSPVRERLHPGHYLVVAYLEDGSGRFHEVYRYVPQEGETVVGAFPHLHWKVDSRDPGTVMMHDLRIPPASVTEGMAFIEGSERASIGVPGSTEVPWHYRSIPGFFIDPHETTVADYRRHRDHKVSGPPDLRWQQPPTEDYAVVLNWDAAVHEAEFAGKRLPHEFEYEFAATRGQLQTLWTRAAEEATDGSEEIGPVGAPEFDRLDTSPPVFGLRSNVAEWTMSWGSAFYPGLEQFQGLAWQNPSITDYRVIKGGDESTLNGNALVSQRSRDPRQRQLAMKAKLAPGLGFRGVRSASPRLHVEDFVHLIDIQE